MVGGLRLTVGLANVHGRRWLDEIANARVHKTAQAMPVKHANFQTESATGPNIKPLKIAPKKPAPNGGLAN